MQSVGSRGLAVRNHAGCVKREMATRTFEGTKDF
jgi:hypothetical protein